MMVLLAAAALRMEGLSKNALPDLSLPKDARRVKDFARNLPIWRRNFIVGAVLREFAALDQASRSAFALLICARRDAGAAPP